MLIPQKREGSGVGFRLGLVLESGGGGLFQGDFLLEPYRSYSALKLKIAQKFNGL